MRYQINKFIVRVYLRTHFRCAWNLSRLCCIDDQLDWLSLNEFKMRYGSEIQSLKCQIPDFILDHYGLL